MKWIGWILLGIYGLSILSVTIISTVRLRSKKERIRLKKVNKGKARECSNCGQLFTIHSFTVEGVSSKIWVASANQPVYMPECECHLIIEEEYA